MISSVPLTDPDQSAIPAVSLRHCLNAAQLGSWQYDAPRRAFRWDTRSKEILGVPATGATVEEFMNWVQPDDTEGVWATFNAVLDPAQPKRYGNEFRVRRGDGEVRWVETRALAYFEENEWAPPAVSLVGTIADITERKEREEKERLLMEEINHRAKNMLSVARSIAKETATQTPEDFIERFSGRIHALLATQDLLVRNVWDGVEIEDLVRAQLAHFADGSRIATDGPKLRMMPASAQAIGLALHELATNAGKYGSLSVDGGRVDIGWGTDSDTFTMSWV